MVNINRLFYTTWKLIITIQLCSCVYCSILVQSISLKMTVYHTNFHFCVTWKLSWDTHHQPKLYIFIERILIYNIWLNRYTCTPWYIWIIFGLICYVYIIVQQNLLISIFNLFASTIYVQTKAKYNFQMFYKMFTANDLHIIVRYCTYLLILIDYWWSCTLIGSTVWSCLILDAVDRDNRRNSSWLLIY